MSILVEGKNLRKYFKTPGGWIHAVDGVSFRIEEGKTLGIVGESGCGKSTLGRVTLRLLEPTGGDIVFDGENITRTGKRRLKNIRKNMQMIFQDPFSSIDPRMTVSEIIAEPLEVYGVCSDRRASDARVAELMEKVGLAGRLANAYPHELDGGRRQRVGIARALALDPRFIVCDEPVSALDVSIQAQILNLMMDIQDEKSLTYMFITHDLSVVRHISDDIGVMYLGHMVEICDAKAIFRHQLHPYTQALISAIPTVDIDNKRKLIPLKGEISSPIEPGPGCLFAPRCAYAAEICRNIRPELLEQEAGHFAACHFALKADANAGEV